METIRIISPDGVGRGSKITNAKTGEEIQGITKISVSISGIDEFNRATLEICPAILDITAQASYVMPHPVHGGLRRVRSIEFADGEVVEF